MITRGSHGALRRGYGRLTASAGGPEQRTAIPPSATDQPEKKDPNLSNDIQTFIMSHLDGIPSELYTPRDVPSHSRTVEQGDIFPDGLIRKVNIFNRGNYVAASLRLEGSKVGSVQASMQLATESGSREWFTPPPSIEFTEPKRHRPTLSGRDALERAKQAFPVRASDQSQ
jgi:hypothetical protein